MLGIQNLGPQNGRRRRIPATMAAAIHKYLFQQPFMSIQLIMVDYVGNWFFSEHGNSAVNVAASRNKPPQALADQRPNTDGHELQLSSDESLTNQFGWKPKKQIFNLHFKDVFVEKIHPKYKIWVIGTVLMRVFWCLLIRSRWKQCFIKNKTSF